MPYLDYVGMMTEEKPYAYLGKGFALDARDYVSFAMPPFAMGLGTALGGLFDQKKTLALGLGAMGGLAVPMTVLRTERKTRILTADELADDGCVACLPMNEGEGEWAYDLSGHDNDGYLGNGNAASMPSWVEDEEGKGLDFDGVDDYIEIAHADSLNVISGGITVEFVAKLSPTGRSQVVVSKRYNTKPFWTLWIRESDQAAQWQIANSETETGMNSLPAAHSWGQCHRVAITQQGGEGRIYFDGQLASQLTLPISVAETGNDNPLLIGKSAGFAIKGCLYEFRLYNRALGASEIWSHQLGSSLLSPQSLATRR